MIEQHRCDSCTHLSEDVFDITTCTEFTLISEVTKAFQISYDPFEVCIDHSVEICYENQNIGTCILQSM